MIVFEETEINFLGEEYDTWLAEIITTNFSTLTEKHEVLIAELKEQTAQHKIDWEEMQRLTKQIEQKDKANDQLKKENDELLKKMEALIKEVARLNQINGTDGWYQ